MDLRGYPGAKGLDEDELLGLWWYQPFNFTDDIVAGESAQWSIKGLDRSIIRQSDNPKQFKKFWDISTRTSRMYEAWGKALVDLSKVDLKQSNVFEMACNTGSLLFSMKEWGAKECVGVEKVDIGRQQEILGNITGINDIDFRSGGWSSESHSLQGLSDDERFDLVICTAFAMHMGDPLHVLREMAARTKKAMLFHNLVGYLNFGMRVRYVPAPHHERWGDQFPNNFDTRISRKLLAHSLMECGFKEVIQLNYSRKWLSWPWYRLFSTVVCIK